MVKHKKHTLCIDFESSILSPEIRDKNLTNQQLLNIDQGYTIDSLEKTLRLLKKHHQKVTFFVVIKLAELYPGLIEKILKEGHEVGWHGYLHRDLDDERLLQKELLLSKRYILKYNMKGFQAPRIVFNKTGYKYLKKYNFIYSSSIYGNSNTIYNINDIFEIPVSTTNTKYNPDLSALTFPSHMNIKNIFSFGLPIGSSYFWSILGVNYYHNYMKNANKKNRHVNLFIHNWQLFPEQKQTTIKSNIQLFIKEPLFYPYRINVLPLFEMLLKNFSFQPCINYLYEKKNLSNSR